jgi:drug/metabolite transporter (DMT)-like permease
MRAVQISFGLVIVLIGLLLLIMTSGLVALTPLDLTGYAFILSGLCFWVPGIAWRRTLPWLTALFLPGALAFAIGAGLMYTQRTEAGVGAWSYLWTILLIALGIGFLAMYWLGPHTRWLRFVGIIIGGVGILLFAIFGMAFSSDPATRLLGPVLLIALGLVFAVGALLPRK